MSNPQAVESRMSQVEEVVASLREALHELKATQPELRDRLSSVLAPHETARSTMAEPPEPLVPLAQELAELDHLVRIMQDEQLLILRYLGL